MERVAAGKREALRYRDKKMKSSIGHTPGLNSSLIKITFLLLINGLNYRPRYYRFLIPAKLLNILPF